MVRRLTFLILSNLFLLTFVGCGVPYGEVGSRGGYKSVPIGNDQFEITYLSNTSGGQASARMQDLTLLRAAEIALKYRFTHFVVEDNFENVKTKWVMKSTTSPIGGGGMSTGGTTIGGSPTGGISLGGSPTGGVSIGGSPSSGIGLGSTGGGMGGMGSRSGTITSSTPVPVAIPELTIRIRCHHGIPTTAFQGELYDAARLRDILATQYNIKIEVDARNQPAKAPPVYQVIE